MNIYITRHGETEWNRYWRLQGRSDVQLSEKGKKQAELTHEGFLKSNISFDIVYSSPLKRAFETAILMSGKKENEIIKDNRIIEFCFGEAEGKTPKEREENPDLRNFNLFFDDPEKYIPLKGAESFDEVFSRTNNFLEEEIKPLEKKGIQNVLIVTHGGAMQSLLMGIDGRELKEFWKVKMSNCTINKIVLNQGIFKIEYTGKIFYEEDNTEKGFFQSK